MYLEMYETWCKGINRDVLFSFKIWCKTLTTVLNIYISLLLTALPKLTLTALKNKLWKN